MKLIFNHDFSIYDGIKPLIYLEAERETESCQYMFENGWVPYDNKWYQTQSSRLKLGEISKKRKYELNKINISENKHNEIIEPPKLEDYQGEHYDFFFDDIFWGRVNFYENQILYSVMNGQIVKSKKSYGTLSFYYLIDKFRNDYEYLYITDFFGIFSYKQSLPGFQYWNGKSWV
jgi:hypothetical protein